MLSGHRALMRSLRGGQNLPGIAYRANISEKILQHKPFLNFYLFSQSYRTFVKLEYLNPLLLPEAIL